MDIFITDFNSVRQKMCVHDCTHLLSVISFDKEVPLLPAFFDTSNWKVIRCEDVMSEKESKHAPTRNMVDEVLRWAKALPPDARLLVHCHGGVSRSTAIASAIKLQEFGNESIDNVLDWLVTHRPQACPNPMITKFADDILKCNGEFHEKSELIANTHIIKKF